MEQRRNAREIPEKTRRPAASSGMIPAYENPGATRLGVEPSSTLSPSPFFLFFISENTLASLLGALGSIPGGVVLGFSHVGIVPGDATGSPVFSRRSLVSPVLSFRRCYVLISLHPHLLSRPRLMIVRLGWVGGGKSIETLVRFHPGAVIETVHPALMLISTDHFDPGATNHGFPHVGIVQDDAVGRCVFSGITRFPPSLHSGDACLHPSTALKTQLRLDCAPVQCFARRGDESVDTRVLVAPSAPTLLGVRRAQFLQPGGHLKHGSINP
ncbi:hypothetical protein PR048_025663 [Dryococelus australis]|uniref:Uncharacterized protein n=1 Tax=Dryococelus australis TaxID=614101 RepID=A0ABQ9GJ61_9NEOP|nr:hypothetical protein PR048_025663 [Dryococelus australis]